MVKKKPTPRPVPFPLRFDGPLRKRLDELAERDSRSLTNYLMKLIREHVAAEDAKDAAIKG